MQFSLYLNEILRKIYVNFRKFSHRSLNYVTWFVGKERGNREEEIKKRKLRRGKEESRDTLK